MRRFERKYGVWTVLWIAVCLLVSGCGQRQQESAAGESETMQSEGLEGGEGAGSGAPVSGERVGSRTEGGEEAGSGAPVSGEGVGSRTEGGEEAGSGALASDEGAVSTEESGVPVLAEAEAVKEYLAAFPSSPEELSGQPCYIAAHGKEIGGRKYVEEFMEKVRAGEDAALVVVEYTIEGDPVFNYLSFREEQKEQVYRLSDASRDNWAGDEKYREYRYTDVWTEIGQPDEILEEGSSEEEEPVIYFILYVDNSYQDGVPQRIFCVIDESGGADAEIL